MVGGNKPADSQRKQAVITGVVLAAMAVGIYAVVLLKYFTSP